MKKIKIGIDMDEVLSESVDFIFQVIGYQVNGFQLSKDAIRDYNDVFFGTGISFSETTRIYKEGMEKDIGKLEIRPVEGSIEKIKEFENLGHELFIVTARNSDFFTDYTIEWTKKYYQNAFRNVLFSNQHIAKYVKKSEICIENGIEIMIEDNLDYALELAKNGIKTFLLEKPWNIHRDESHDKIIRVKTWKDIII